MKLIADSRGRLTCAELFVPGKPYSAEKQADGSIRVIELVESDVPVVRPRRVNGKLRWPQDRNVTRAQIAAAIRAERDNQ